MWAPGTAAAIGRSIDIYFRDADRLRRMQALLARFVRPNGLAFDIGGHLGDRSLCLAGLGARVVTLEPQPAMARALRLILGRNPRVTVDTRAAGPREGTARMHLNSRNPTVSTLSRAFVERAARGPGWQGQAWDRGVTVEVTTLDALIDRHGVPDFVKIDVEGFEAEVLAGLSQPLRALSFEVTSLRPDVGRDCVARLASLGSYGFNLSLGETHGLRYAAPVEAARISREIERLSHEENSADVYALLR